MDRLPYAEVTEPGYAERAAATFQAARPAPGTLLLTGPCPRCGTVIQVPVVDGVYKTTGRFRVGGRREPAPSERLEPLICTCEEEHPGRPAGRAGCGAYWLLRITVDAP
ncbi:hypothetical protein AB0J86_25775 [Micromonospora sp. NPDC049559]|uniref:hypothetical protein n=1 Tax=Micromonospora sp. NPDC049559 TaxID=3155923 RepID=UPI0034226F09